MCDALLTAAKESGHMKTSQVGGIGTLSDDIRTSSTLAITKDILAACPDLKAPLQQLLDAALQLVGQGLDTSALSSMQFVRPSSADQLCPELPQIAHYLPGAPKPVTQPIQIAAASGLRHEGLHRLSGSLYIQQM
jgi:hypothetical protein